MKEKCIKILKKLTGKNFILFTNRGNTSIKLALKYSRENHEKLYIPDQGGWITYKQFGEKFKFNMENIKSNFSYINLDKLKVENHSVILINSMAAYAFLLPMERFTERCFKKHCFLINDASGSIGTNQAKFGDLIIGSFGKIKPVQVEYGGFIATDNLNFVDFFKKQEVVVEDFYNKLYEKLIGLEKRLQFFQEKKKKVLEDLKDYDILHRDKVGINVIVKFHTLKEKENIINYCEKENIEYVICPKDIKVICDAISIEIKRL